MQGPDPRPLITLRNLQMIPKAVDGRIQSKAENLTEL